MILTARQRRDLQRRLDDHKAHLQQHIQDSEQQATQLACRIRQAQEHHQAYCIQANAEAARLTGQVEVLEALLAEPTTPPAALLAEPATPPAA